MSRIINLSNHHLICFNQHGKLIPYNNNHSYYCSVQLSVCSWNFEKFTRAFTVTTKHSSSSRNHESFEAGSVGRFSFKNPMRDLNFRLPADYIHRLWKFLVINNGSRRMWRRRNLPLRFGIRGSHLWVLKNFSSLYTRSCLFFGFLSQMFLFV